MNFTVVIPARYASHRLPGKPLMDVAGKPMIQRVYERAQRSSAKRVLVATDDQRIFNEVAHFAGEVVLTSSDHQSGTDRIYEAALHLGLNDDDIVVNVQGDEPLIPPEVIDQVAKNLHENKDADAATLSTPVTDYEQLIDPNVVKVVADYSGSALYFSRAPIPWCRDEFQQSDSPNLPENRHFRHLGIYAYRMDLLTRFVRWPIAPLEEIEKLEQLRILHNGKKIMVEPASVLVPAGVDTLEDLQRVQSQCLE